MNLPQPCQRRVHPAATKTRRAPDTTHDAVYMPGHDALADGTRLQPGQAFAQSWRLRNSGSTVWELGCVLLFVGGERLGAVAAVPVPVCPVGESIAIAVGFVAPAVPGHYQSIWQLATPDGLPFGDQVWAEIEVTAMPMVEKDMVATGPLSGDLAPSPEQRLPLPTTTGALQTVVNTWNQYGGFLLQEAQRLGIAPAVAVAVLAAESNGQPFDANGRLLIRFENHIFYTHWGKTHEELFRQHFTFASDESWKEHRWRPDPAADWQPVHHNQESEWGAFHIARTLDEDAALYAISMGAPQIMGFNHSAIGYATVQAMFTAFSSDVRAQLGSLFRFIEVKGLVNAVRNGDFLAFATLYNGSGQAQSYQQIIQQHFDAYQSLVAPGTRTPLSATANARLPQPLPPLLPDHKRLAEADPELYMAWRKHIEQGFENNQTMFSRILAGFMNPYWLTVIMYVLLFVVGFGAFVVSVILGLRATSVDAAQANAVTTILGSSAIFGGISVVAFLTYFLSRPLQALEENLQFITWLGIIYNTYWTRLAYIQKLETVQAALESATADAISKIIELMNKHSERSGNRPTFPGIGNIIRPDKP